MAVLFQDGDWASYRIVDVVDHQQIRTLCAHCGEALRYEVVVEGGRYGRRGIGMTCAEKIGASAAQIREIRRSIAGLKSARQEQEDRAAARAHNDEIFADIGGIAGVEAALQAAKTAAEARIAGESVAISEDDRAVYQRAAFDRYLPFPAHVLDILRKASLYRLSEKQVDAIADALVALESFDLGAVPAVRVPGYLGSVGDKITVDGRIVRFVAGEAYTYGAATPWLVVVETLDGDTATTWTTAAWLDKVKTGDSVTLAGTVKALNVYDHTPQTVLTRVKLLSVHADEFAHGHDCEVVDA
jgi:hypothetical protein